MNAVLINKTNGEILKRGQYPRTPIEPIEGLDTNLEWLLEYKPFVMPDYDPRIFTMQIIEEITQIPHPVYSFVNQFKVTYLPVKRNVEEIKHAVVQKESQVNESLLPLEKRVKILTLGMGVLFRKINGLQLNAKEQAIADNVMDLAVKMWKNDTVMKAKIVEIESNIEPNIDDVLWESGQ